MPRFADQAWGRRLQSVPRPCGRHRQALPGGAAPSAEIARRRQRLTELRLRLRNSARERVARTSNRLAVLAAELDVVSPLKTLERGYAVVTDKDTGMVIRDARDLTTGQRISGRVHRGRFDATVDSSDDD